MGNMSPKGTTELHLWRDQCFDSVVPPGLADLPILHRFPTMNRWAIIGCPCGTKTTMLEVLTLEMCSTTRAQALGLRSN